VNDAGAPPYAGPVPATAGPQWRAVFAQLPRAVFLPDLFWPFTPGTPPAPVHRGRAPAAWLAAARSDAPVITQWDDGEHQGEEPGTVPTSSASAPPLVATMLAALDVEPGMRVLEVGTGTGWNAGLLARRLGEDRVVTVDVDEQVAAGARAALARAGLRPQVVCGDGMLGVPDCGPYDRLIATCGIRHIPPGWLAQVRPGGVILAPWGTAFSAQDALVKLTVRQDGSACGRILELVEFMKARAHRDRRTSCPGDLPLTDTDSEVWPPPGPWHPFPFIAGLRIPRAAHAVQEHEDGVTQWLYDLTAPGWTAAVRRKSVGPGVVVRRAGGRRLWEELTGAHAWWRAAGEPGIERLGLSVDADGSVTAWLDQEDQAVPVLAGRAPTG
jgi:protein-L-isoaspartate O-methyltransferase